MQQNTTTEEQKLHQNGTTEDLKKETHIIKDIAIDQGTTSTTIEFRDLSSNALYDVKMFVKLKYGKYSSIRSKNRIDRTNTIRL